MSSFEYRKPWGFRRQAREKVWQGLEDAKRRLSETSSGHVSAPVVLIVDTFAQEMLGSMFTAAEIQDAGFLVLEPLEVSRTRYPTFKALYFMLPSKHNIKVMIKDFNFPPPTASDDELEPDWADKCCPCIFKPLELPLLEPKYQSCMLLAISATKQVDTDWVLNRVSTKHGEVDKFSDRFRGVDSLFVEFLAPEADLFLLNVPDAFTLSEPARYGRSSERQAELEATAKEIASRLASVCFTLEEFPIIRYGGGVRGTVTAGLARQTSARLVQLASRMKGKSGEGATKRPVLLIVDRVEDLLTPLLHDFGYQALATEMPKMRPFKPFKYKHKKIKRKVLLDDQDPVWIGLRHAHIATADRKIRKEISRLYAEQEETERLRVQMRHGGKEGKKALAKLAASVMTADKVLPAKIKQHFHMIESLFKLMEQHSFTRLAEVEQTLATGYDERGSTLKAKRARKLVTRLLDELEIRDDDKERLFALFWVAADCDDNKTMRAFVKERLDKPAYNMVSNLRTLDCSFSHLQHVQSAAKRVAEQFRVGRSTRLRGVDETKGMDDEDLDLSLSRHTPYVSNVTKLLLCDTLEEGSDGFAALPDAAPHSFKTAAVTGTGGGAYRKKTHRTAAGTEDDEEDEETKPAVRGVSRRKRGTGKKYDSARDLVADITLADDGDADERKDTDTDVVIVFITGGITFAETRALDEISKARPYLRIIYGGTTALTPDDFLCELGKLATAEHDDDDGDDSDASAGDVDVGM